MKIAVLGAGAWGTALAIAAAARHDTLLWVRDAAQAQALRTQRRNVRYLGEVPLPPVLRITSDVAQALDHGAGVRSRAHQGRRQGHRYRLAGRVHR